jgi:hypothetical protein
LIARIWRGWTTTDDADDYVAYLQTTGIPAYRATPGNRAAYILRRSDGERTEFITLTLWTSLDAVKAFAGEDGPVETPWGDTNVRVRAPDGMQLTLFTTP